MQRIIASWILSSCVIEERLEYFICYNILCFLEVAISFRESLIKFNRENSQLLYVFPVGMLRQDSIGFQACAKRRLGNYNFRNSVRTEGLSFLLNYKPASDVGNQQICYQCITVPLENVCVPGPLRNKPSMRRKNQAGIRRM